MSQPRAGRRTPFEERFLSLLASELRRQGMGGAPLESVVATVRQCTSTTAASAAASTTRPSSDDDSDSSGLHGITSTRAFVLALGGRRLGDRAVIAVCEVLLRCHNGAALQTESLSGADVWRVVLRDNGLSDRAVRHLSLLVQTCERLTLLDVAQNAFTEEGRDALLQAVSESAIDCEVVLDMPGTDRPQTTSSISFRTAGGATAATGTQPSASSAVLERYQQHWCARTRGGGSVSRDTADRSPDPRRGGSGGGEGLAVEGAAAATATPAGIPELRRWQPSPSTSTAATSATSRSNFASGNAEALRKRREELFGRSPGASEAAATLSVPHSLATPIDAPAPAADAPATPPAKLEEIEVEATPSPLPKPRHHEQRKKPQQQLENEEEKEEKEGTRGSPFGGKASQPPPSAPASREPFEPNDHLDIAANLSPVLDNALDLSSMMDAAGNGLRDAARFGGAASVWEIVEAYEEAAEATLLSGGDVSVLPGEVSARLPPTLLANDSYSALTVLNISNNGLREIRALPPSLLRLDVSRNALTSLSGLHQCRMLTVLNARRNQITRIAGLEHNLCIAHLFLGRNGIAYVEGLAHLLLLETLDLSYNMLRTQASVRALSLCSVLQHLLVRGNPFIGALKSKNPKPLVRSLCPTLVALDDDKMGPSRYGDAAQRGLNHLRTPAAAAAAAPLTSTLAARAAGPPARSRDTSTADARMPYGEQRTLVEASVVGDAPSDEQQHAMGLLHLLTRGVTTPGGYRDPSKAASTVRSIDQRQQQKEALEERRRGRELTAGGRPLRATVVEKLAAASQKYLETTIVQRMAALQQQQAAQQRQQQHQDDRDGDDEDDGAAPVPRPSAAAATATAGYAAMLRGERSPLRASHDPMLGDSPMAELMGSTRPPPRRAGSADDDASVLLPYQPTKFRAPSKHHRSSASPPPRRSAPATSASPIGRRSASTAAPDVGRRSPSIRRQPPPGAASADPHSPPAGTPGRHRDPELVECSPIRCFDDSGLYTSLLDAGATPLATTRPQLRSAPFNITRTAPPPTYSIGHRAPPHAKTVVPRGDDWGSHHSHPQQQQQQQRRPPEGRARSPSTEQRSAALSATAFPHGAAGRRVPRLAPQPAAPVATPTPMQTDGEQRRRVREWAEQLVSDTDAVQAALRTVVQLLEAQRQAGMPPPESSAELPRTYIDERRRCTDIVRDSGMLHDTHVPIDAVMYYGLSKGELETGEPAPAAVAVGRGRGGAGRGDPHPPPPLSKRDAAEKEEVLRHVRQLSDAKTCLKYMILLIGDGRERLLQQYVDRVKESIAEL